jgi:hypothetical protein
MGNMGTDGMLCLAKTPSGRQRGMIYGPWRRVHDGFSTRTRGFVNANRHERIAKPFATELQAQFSRRSSLTSMKVLAKVAQAAR